MVWGKNGLQRIIVPICVLYGMYFVGATILIASIFEKNRGVDMLLDITPRIEQLDKTWSSTCRGDIPSSENYDTIEKCTFWRQYFRVLPGSSWGNLPMALQNEWGSLQCDDNSIAPFINCHIGFATGAQASRSTSEQVSPMIAILAGISTRGLTWSDPRDLALFRHLLPSVVQTVECGFRYSVVLGYDLGDAFYDTNEGRTFLERWFQNVVKKRLCGAGMEIDLVLVAVNNTLQKPGPVFNEVARAAFDAGAEYFYRVNDDSEFLSPWASKFVNVLQELGWPYGVVGPSCNESNTAILNHDFTHRTHMHIFNRTYYPPELTDWYMDDWVSRIYGSGRTRQVRSVGLLHHTKSQSVRYYVDFYRKDYLEGLIGSGRERIANYMQRDEASEEALNAYLSSQFFNFTVPLVE